ncbi:MAG TPA: 3D domain-containing protein [Acetivibrio sp.]|uniref:3D domain-containing protein n=1 Tax=Acetivibrio sp. TaxID=1872092 RepID=UPI002C16C599|nr:3D domain-containing protein [Acetivibrio sp.]HOM02522.1 3D domain-containing protein [Acetivibrio sp.]
MLSDDVPSSTELQKCNKPSKINKIYGTIIYFLLVVIISLIVNNIIIYNWYNNTKTQFKDTFLRVQTISEENMSLETLNETLKNDYALLKEDYSKILSENESIKKEIEELKKKNEDIERINKELVEDNIELQNTLKLAAAAGVKPQNYTEFKGISSKSSIERGQYIGKFLGTAYTPSKEECGNDIGITNSGKPIIPGISIAIDKNYWPFGTVFYIKGLGYAVAMDTGSAIKGKYRFDFAVFDKNFANQLGANYWDVYLVKLGDGKVEDISL